MTLETFPVVNATLNGASAAMLLAGISVHKKGTCHGPRHNDALGICHFHDIPGLLHHLPHDSDTTWDHRHAFSARSGSADLSDDSHFAHNPGDCDSAIDWHYAVSRRQQAMGQTSTDRVDYVSAVVLRVCDGGSGVIGCCINLRRGWCSDAPQRRNRGCKHRSGFNPAAMLGDPRRSIPFCIRCNADSSPTRRTPGLLAPLVSRDLHPREVREHPQPNLLALLRVKLRGNDIVAPDTAHERAPIVSSRRDHILVVGDDVIPVNEVDAAPPREDRAGSATVASPRACSIPCAEL